jgi:uncharacterized protein
MTNLFSGLQSPVSSLQSQRPFVPAWWCPGAHAQTIFARFFRPHSKLALRRERIETPDGDFLDLDWLRSSNTRLALVLHGLEGSTEAPYIQTILNKLQVEGFDAAAVNFRSCSGEANRCRESYHSGKTEDLACVLNYIFKMKKYTEISLIGYSIGGNIILKWLGEKADSVPKEIVRAVAVSVPYDLVKAVEELDKGFNREVYTRTLLRSLKKKIAEKEKIYPGSVNFQKVKASKTFREFDREVTARLNGFKDEMDYWTHSSSKYFLKQIRIPTLLLHAKDDPFFPAPWIPIEDIEKSFYLKLILTEKGGHLGFVSGKWPWRQEMWLEEVILDFLK